MNGINKITTRIESDANKEAEEIMAESARECAGIKAKYDQLAQEEYLKVIRSGVKDCELRVQRLASTAAMEARKSILSLKQQMVASAFDRARELVVALPNDEYLNFLVKLTADAVRSGSEIILLNERDHKLYGKKLVKSANEMLKEKGLSGQLTLGDTLRPIMGGLILKDGDIEVNCSVETLAELYRNELSSQVAEALFE